VGPLFWCQCFR